MGKVDNLLKNIKEYNQDREKELKSSKAVRLRHKIMNEKHTNEEWLALQEELRAFIATNPSEDELKQLQGCGESLSMICSAINKGKL